MSKIRESGDTKERILSAARQEFIEKGYEKAKMEDIARKAGVTKVMLYYHFNSKNNILREILIKTLKMAEAGFKEEFNNITDIDKFNLNFDIIKTKIENIMIPNIEIIKLILTQAMKNNLMDINIMEPLKNFFNIVAGLVENSGIKIIDREELYIKIFFFQSAPLIFNLMFANKFMEDLKIPQDKVNRVFAEKFSESFMGTIEKYFTDQKIPLQVKEKEDPSEQKSK
jgi:AcrR family transcriptional regulator